MKTNPRKQVKSANECISPMERGGVSIRLSISAGFPCANDVNISDSWRFYVCFTSAGVSAAVLPPITLGALTVGQKAGLFTGHDLARGSGQEVLKLSRVGSSWVRRSF